jgi:hypothetical protein
LFTEQCIALAAGLAFIAAVGLRAGICAIDGVVGSFSGGARAVRRSRHAGSRDVGFADNSQQGVSRGPGVEHVFIARARALHGLVLLLKRSPFTPEEIAKALAFVERNELELVYASAEWRPLSPR